MKSTPDHKPAYDLDLQTWPT